MPVTVAIVLLLSLFMARGEEQETRMHRTEGSNITDFVIQKGDRFLLAAPNGSHVIRYDAIKPASRMLLFYDETEQKPIRVQYESLTRRITILGQDMAMMLRQERSRRWIATRENGVERIGGSFAIRAKSRKPIQRRIIFTNLGKRPLAFDSHHLLLGEGRLRIDDMSFAFFVSNAARNPLVVDLDGDGRISGKK